MEILTAGEGNGGNTCLLLLLVMFMACLMIPDSTPVLLLNPELHWPTASSDRRVCFLIVNPSSRLWTVRLVGLTLNNRPVALRAESLGLKDLTVPVYAPGKWLTPLQLRLISSGCAAIRQGWQLPPAAGELFDQAVRAYRAMEREEGKRIRPVELDLRGVLPEERGDNRSLEVGLEFEARDAYGRRRILRGSTTARLRSFPVYPGWYHGDLHSHSTYSDGLATLSELRKRFLHEYDFMYLTDHCDRLTGRFQEYAAACEASSTPEFSFFPGVEVTAAGTSGEALAYGLKDIEHLQNRALTGQQLLDRIATNQPGRSTAAIAHPYGIVVWQDWSVRRYFGYELMNGLQLSCGAGSRTARRWREELNRCRADALAYGFCPSARTGMDYHLNLLYFPFHTWVLLPEDWRFRSYRERHRQLDLALLQGRTAVSRQGSLTVLTLNGYPVGSVLKKLPPGSELSLKVWFCPVMGGKYRISLYEGGKELEARRVSLEALRPFSFETRFPAGRGQRFYLVYVEGDAEVAYTSPIYVAPGG